MRSRVLLVSVVGAVSFGCRADSLTAPGSPAAAATTASTLAFYQVSLGRGHTCGVTFDNRAYCWGGNADGELGDGTTNSRDGPVPVATTLRFRQISAGALSTCAVTTDYRLYCWGFNEMGQLGDGTTVTRLRPVVVTGGRQFRQVEIGFEHACGVTYQGNRAYCWGYNRYGQLGIGTNTGPEFGPFGEGPFSSKPLAVLGGLTFRQVTAGDTHNCGVTTDNRAFCWGYNRYGQVGDSSGGWFKFRPARVAGGQQYRQIDAGYDHTCAATTGYRAFCWGRGVVGELGNGTMHMSRWPTPVSGGLSLERVTAGSFFTCAESTTNRGYCWGWNWYGQLGDGTQIDRATPVAVVGGLFFSQLSAGSSWACGRTPAGAAYCWGSGNLTPIPAPGPS